MITLPRALALSATAAFLLLAPLNFAQQSASGAAPSMQRKSALIKAPAGAVEGQMDGDLRVFKGIPYALPPVGSQRWRPPVPMPRWAGIRKATEFGPICFQPVSPVPSIYSWTPAPMSEDCLTLNIWAPTRARK